MKKIGVTPSSHSLSMPQGLTSGPEFSVQGDLMSPCLSGARAREAATLSPRCHKPGHCGEHFSDLSSQVLKILAGVSASPSGTSGAAAWLWPLSYLSFLLPQTLGRQ